MFHHGNPADPLGSQQLGCGILRTEWASDLEIQILTVTAVPFVLSARLREIKSLKRILAKRTNCALGGVGKMLCGTVSGGAE